jgi:hypothetical protein
MLMEGILLSLVVTEEKGYVILIAVVHSPMLLKTESLTLKKNMLEYLSLIGLWVLHSKSRLVAWPYMQILHKAEMFAGGFLQNQRRKNVT